MARFEDSPELFGVGVGSGSDGPLTCNLCGREYPETPGETQAHLTYFAGMQVADCCFEIIEAEIIRRMPSILSWFERLVQKAEVTVVQRQEALKSLREALSETQQPLSN